MQERRNLYRTLYAQPDAPFAVIEANHRVLMQNLKLCPDQNFADLQASLFNTAYTVLQDPLKRADYDRQLQKRHSVNQLSLGSFAAGLPKNFTGRSGRTISNQRNFYRVLQIQPDAPVEIIIASYRILLNYPFQDADLLEEAYTVLVNPSIRAQYDAQLAGGMMTGSNKLIPAKGAQCIIERGVTDHTVGATQANRTALPCCIFCHTPYLKQVNPYQNDVCLECASPLPALIDEQLEQTRRENLRISAQGKFKFYLFWPDTPHEGVLQDLSPRGVRFLADAPLEPYDIIKIDAQGFKAVAEIVHKQIEDNLISTGVRFLTFQFEQKRGNFLSESV